MSLCTATIATLRQRLLAKEISPSEIVQDLAKNIEAQNETLGAYLSWDLDAALKAADEVDLSAPLGGIPIAFKDNINVKGQPCTCASRLFEGGYTAPYNATVTHKLTAAGAIPFGRANMDEFAMGSSTENSALRRTLNPQAPRHIPGGSSGGSASAVSSHMAIAALGSDTGGSIRQPASHCGIVGLKPSYGRVSRYGLVAFASSLDQIGPMTKTVEDAALLLESLAGTDGRDSTCLDAEVPSYTKALHKGVKGLKIGLPTEYFGEGLDPRVKELVMNAAKKLEKEGAELVEISLPNSQHAVATYYIIAPAEASSNLSRFDGVRYGNRAEEPRDMLDLYSRSRAEGFGSEVKRRIILGTYVLSSGYYDAYYTRAQKVRTLIQQDFTQAFEQVDAILSPVSPTPPRKLEEAKEDPLKDYLADIYTISANLSGICAMSVPCGTLNEEGDDLPIGLQIMAPHLGEETLFQIGSTWEKIRG